MRPVTAFLVAMSCFGLAVAGFATSATADAPGWPAGSGSTCGDGVIDLSEECDDGNADNTDGCVAGCVLAVCGDNLVLGSAPPVQVLKDGSFENGTPNDFWDEESTNFGTPLCDITCGEDVATDGSWYAWFGGVPGALEVSALRQSITLPEGAISATLSFQLAPFCSGVAQDFFRVSAGGSVLLEFGMDAADHPTGPCNPNDYYLQVLDLTDFLGQTFELEMISTTGTTGELSNIFVDEVSIEVVLRTEQCDDGNAIPGDGCEPDCTLGLTCEAQDVDDNGSSDVLWRHEESGLVGAWLQDQTSVVSWCEIGTEPSSDWQVAGAGDFDDDGLTDILWRHAPSGDVGAWTLGGSCDITGWHPIGTEPSSAWHIVSVADIDRDGRSDIVWWNQNTGHIGAWLTSATGIASWCSILTEPPASGWRIQGTGDFDRDGSADLLWRNTTSGSVGTLSLDGCSLGSFTYLPTEPTNTGWQIQAVADFNGDCGSDVLWRNTTTGDIGLWVMDGTVVDHWVYLAQEPTNSGWEIQGPR